MAKKRIGLHPRVRQVREFFKEGGSVCPFAKQYAVQGNGYIFLQAGQKGHKVTGPLLSFARGNQVKSLVYVFPTDLEDHFREREVRVKLFKRLQFALLEAEHGTAEFERRKDAVEATLDRHLSLESDRNPHLTFGYERFFSIGMGPLYEDMKHPRWAPVSIAVVNRHRDVAEVSQKVSRSIRDRAHERYGGPYDADELYIIPGITGLALDGGEELERELIPVVLKP